MWQITAAPFTASFRMFPRRRVVASARCGQEAVHDSHGDRGSRGARPSVAALSAQEGGRWTAGETAASAAAPLNLNTASVPQLETLPGIGKATAERIVDGRQKKGGFNKEEGWFQQDRGLARAAGAPKPSRRT